MRKLKLLFLALSFLMLAGCTYEPEYATSYEYVNGTEWELSVTIYRSDTDSKPTAFELFPGENYTLTLFNRTGERLPLYNSYSIVISNGESRVICYGRDNGAIFQLDSYEFISSPSEYHSIYRYTFEPEFFDNAEPIE